MGKRSQRKGADGERELADLLQQYGYQTVRSPSQNYGTAPDVTGLPGVHIECKRNEKLNLYQAMQQAIDDAVRFGDGMPVVFHRRNRKPWLVTMLLSDWINLYEEMFENRKLVDIEEIDMVQSDQS